MPGWAESMILTLVPSHQPLVVQIEQALVRGPVKGVSSHESRAGGARFFNHVRVILAFPWTPQNSLKARCVVVWRRRLERWNVCTGEAAVFVIALQILHNPRAWHRRLLRRSHSPVAKLVHLRAVAQRQTWSKPQGPLT